LLIVIIGAAEADFVVGRHQLTDQLSLRIIKDSFLRFRCAAMRDSLDVRVSI